MRYTHDCWSIDLPDHWEFEEDEDEEIMSFYDPDGVGAFEVSSFFKEDGDITLEELAELSEEADLELVNLAFLTGYHKKIIEEPETVYQWWLCSASHMIYATYICNTGEEDEEASERDALIHSLRSTMGNSIETS